MAGRGSVVSQLRPEASGLASQFRIFRTGTLSEIRPDNMYQPLQKINLQYFLIGRCSLKLLKPTIPYYQAFQEQFTNSKSWVEPFYPTESAFYPKES